MGIIDSILENPSMWTGERVLDELLVSMYGDERLADRSVPGWLRAVIVLLDFDTHVQMEGLLGWWENRGSDDLDDVIAAFRAVALADQADLLVQARKVLDPRSLDGDPASTRSQASPTGTGRLPRSSTGRSPSWRRSSTSTRRTALTYTPHSSLMPTLA